MTAPTTERKTLRELRESTATLFAKNTTPNKVTCNTATLSFSLEPAGKDDSVKIVPKEALDVPGFQKLWMRKAILISDDPDMEAEISLLMGGHVSIPRKVSVMANDGTVSEVEASVQEPSNRRDILIKTDAEGKPITARCLVGGESIFQSERQILAGEPPLCPMHLPEAGRVVSTPSPDGSWSHQLVTIEK